MATSLPAMPFNLGPLADKARLLFDRTGWWGAATAGGLAYLSLTVAQLLRWRHYRAIHRRYAGRAHDLQPEEAQDVLRLASEWDMPLLSYYSVALALFKTYGIPSISGLLVKTGELGTEDTVSKRYADTGIMVATWSTSPLVEPQEVDDAKRSDLAAHDPRAYLAIARMNWLHRKYKISNDDYLYTLSLFILEPIRWAKRWGWRELSPLECQSRFIVWREVGRLMNIADIPETLEELDAWATEYEERCMVPADSNHELAVHTLNEVTYQVAAIPGLKTLVESIFVCVLEERVRVAMKLPKQNLFMRTFFAALMRSAAFAQRWLLLPRTRAYRYLPREPPTSSDGTLPRLRPNWFTAKPWYKPEQRGIAGLVERMQVLFGIVKTDDVAGPKYKAQGYRIEEMGPLRFEQSGHEQVIREAGDMLGCPLAGHWGKPAHSEYQK